MIIHRGQDTAEHQKELNVLMGRLSRIQQVNAVIGNQRPVVVLAGTVDAVKGFLVEQALQSVTAGHLL